MNFNHEKVIVLKNDAVGDLTQSLEAIQNIIEVHKFNEINSILI